MDSIIEKKKVEGIIYSCYSQFSREGEQFVPEHGIGHVMAGSMTVHTANRSYTFKEGDFYFFRRNHLAKFTKHPPENGTPFKSLSVLFDQDLLRKFSIDFTYKSGDKHLNDGAFMPLKTSNLLKHYITSLLPYLEENVQPALVNLKVNEAIMLLLKEMPATKDVLFDFNDPGKIDLEEFMHKNFTFNVELKRLAYLTGRSLATFKRDFEKIFRTSPSRWLLQKRLQEAYYLIKEKGKRPSDVYLEVGFESIAHFSYSFKKMFGVNPSGV